ncbi:MAG: hypothetical protein WD056_00715 [Gemmatimonadota bacterium]
MKLRRQGRFGVPITGTLALAGVLLGLGVAPAPALAQQPSWGQLEASFELARGRYDNELSRFQQASYQAEQALLDVTAARAAGDAGRLEDAFAAFHGRAFEELTQWGVVAREAERLREAALALIDVLDQREVEVLSMLRRDLTPQSEVALLQDLGRIRTRILEIDQLLDRVGGGFEENLDLRPVISLQEDPRDTPADLRLKAEILDEQAGSYEAIIRNMEVRIAELEQRNQLARAQRDLVADIGRYDDLPLGGRLSRVPADARPATDPADADGGLAQLDPAQQLEFFRAIRDRALENRAFVMEQAELFRDRAEGTPG